MNTLKIKLLILFCLTTLVCWPQDCKNSKKAVRQANKHLDEHEIMTGTKPRILFSKFSKAAIVNFVKSDKGDYLALLFGREFGIRVDITTDNPLIVQFMNDEIVTLYPIQASIGKFTLPVTSEVNRPFYSVNKDQLTLFSSQSIRHIKIYFSSDNEPKKNWGTDDLGTFYDFEIQNERYQSNLVVAAQCILNF